MHFDAAIKKTRLYFKKNSHTEILNELLNTSVLSFN